MTPSTPEQPGQNRLAVRTLLAAGLTALLCTAAALASPPASASTGPDLVKGVAYLLAPSRLIDGHYYEAFPGFSDYGLTIDAAFALAATGADDPALKKIVDFFDNGGENASGQTVDGWTGIGTPYASGGALAKEALLAQVAGYDPHDFGGRDVIAALDASVCTAASTAPDTTCAAAGNYANATSVFSQSLGVIAQLRAGEAGAAAAPVAYLQSLQDPSGSWPSLIPDSGNSDVDSTAIAVMALALVGTPAASAAAAAGVAWIAAQQSSSGGFPGVSPNSVNSTALAVQALELPPANHSAQTAAALSFLAGQQNADGGFNVDPATPGSDVRASTQAVSGAAGTSYATLVRDVHDLPSVPPTTVAPPTASATATHASTPPRTSAAPSPSAARTSSSAATSAAHHPSFAVDPSSTSADRSPFSVDPASTAAAGELAATGAPARPLLGLATLLVVLGSGVLVASRPRRRGARYR